MYDGIIDLNLPKLIIIPRDTLEPPYKHIIVTGRVYD